MLLSVKKDLSDHIYSLQSPLEGLHDLFLLYQSHEQSAILDTFVDFRMTKTFSDIIGLNETRCKKRIELKAKYINSCI